MTDKVEVLETFDPMAFVLALIGAPILVAVFGFWLLLIPVFAVVFGGPVYLVFGTPVFLWMVTRYPPDARIYAFAGFLLQSFLIAVLVGYMEIADQWHLDEVFELSLFGLAFAPVWAAVFAKLYRGMHRPDRFLPVI